MESTSYYKYIWTNAFIDDENKAAFPRIIARATISYGKLFLYDRIDVSQLDHGVAASSRAPAASVFGLASSFDLTNNGGELMRLISKAGTAVSLGLAGLLLIGSVQAKDAAPAVKVETLSKTSNAWDGEAYQAYPTGRPEVTVLKITIPAHSELPWHTHPMENTGYILSGELTLEKKDNGQKMVFKPGQVVNETIGEVHRGLTGDEPVVLIVFYAGQKGMPLSEKPLP